MGAEYINPQWRLPSEKTGNNKKYSMKSFSAVHRVEISGLANSLNLTNKVSISIWFKTTLSQNNYYILGFRGPGTANGFDLGMHGSNIGSYAAFATSGSGGLLVNFAYDDGNWHHYVLTYDGAIRKFYIDSVLKAESAASGNMSLDSSGNYYILATSNSFARGGQGEVVDNCVFDYALSDGGVSVGSTATGQIADLYASTNPMALASTPKAYYPLGNSAHMGSNYLTPNGALQDYVFDFASDLIKVEQSPGINISGNLTLSAWVYIEDDTWNPVISKTTDANNRNYEYAIRPTTRTITFYTNNGSYETTTTSLAVSLNTWTHIVISCESGVTNGTKFYFNNALDTTTGTHTITADTADLYLGVTAWNSFANYFNGKISNVQIWNTNLSTSEVATLYNYGSPIRTLANIPQNSNLKAWYKLDASEAYNSSSTEWSIDNNQNPSYSSSFLNFDGNDRIKIAPNIGGFNSGFGGVELSDNFTVSFWVNTTNTQNLTRLIDGTINNDNSLNSFFKNSGFSNSYPIGQYTLHFSNGPVTSTINDGVWHNLVFSYNHSSTTTKVYTDGIETYSNTSHDASTGNKVSLFCYHSGVGRFLVAKLSNISIWNTSLNASQAAEIYGDGSPKNLLSHSAASNLAHWYTLNNISSGLQDKKGSATHYIGNSGATEYPGFVNALAGDSTGMSQSNLVKSDLLTTSSYSPYSINFTGNSFIEVDSTPILNGATSLSISAWCKIDNNVEEPICSLWVSGNLQYLLRSNTSYGVQFYLQGSWGMQSEGTNQALTPGQWYHVVATWDGSFIYIYVNGSLAITPKAASGTLNTITGQKDWIGRYSANYLDGNLSNVAYWKDTALNQSQVREIYNEGRPSNLHTFSGTAPTAWWQLGSNSSFASNWTFLDEIGSNDVTSTSMLQNAITDGVGTSGNGTSTNMGTATNISGSSPSGEGNSLSVNMTLANIAGGVN